MFVSVLFPFLDWHERVYKIRVPQSRSRFRTRRGPKLTVLYSRCATLRDVYYYRRVPTSPKLAEG